MRAYDKDKAQKAREEYHRENGKDINPNGIDFDELDVTEGVKKIASMDWGRHLAWDNGGSTGVAIVPEKYKLIHPKKTKEYKEFYIQDAQVEICHADGNHVAKCSGYSREEARIQWEHFKKKGWVQE